jgi:nucleoside-diphosphate-sugar epimerase
VNDFHLQCLHDERTHGGTFNLGSGRDHSISEVLSEVQALLGTDVEPLYAPDLPGEAERTCGDISRARSLGWNPQVDLRDGLQRSIEFIRTHVTRPAHASVPLGTVNSPPNRAGAAMPEAE